MLLKPMIYGRIGKWIIAFTEFSLQYVPTKVVKGQVLTDFLTKHPNVELYPVETNFVGLKPWKLYFNSSQHKDGVGVGVLIVFPNDEPTRFMFELQYECSNNEAKYEALIFGLKVLLSWKVKHVKIIGDSSLMAKQVQENIDV